LTPLERLLLRVMPYGISVISVATGLPMALGMIAPNRFYGIRTARTMADPEVWYATNTAGGMAMVVFGIASVIAIYLLHRFWGTDSKLKLVIPVFVPVFFALCAIDITFRYA